MSERAIAFDLGVNFGYADESMSGSHKLVKTRREIDFYNKVLDLTMYSGKKYTTITFEDACFQKGVAIYNFNAQKSILHLVAQSLNLKIKGIPVATIKKQFTGDYRADKKLIKSVASKTRGKIIRNDNESDAVAVYHTYFKL